MNCSVLVRCHDDSSAAAPSGKGRDWEQGCQSAKFDPFASFLGLCQGGGCGGAIQGKEGIKFCSIA